MPRGLARRAFVATWVLAFCVVATISSSARADPQGNASLTIGGAGVGTEGQFWDHPEFHLGARGDVLFARQSASDFGVGPYVELGTFAFDDVQFGGGGSVLLPAHDNFPFVLSAGAYGRWGDDDYGLEPGLTGALFWGSRSYNFHANYVMTGGLLVGFRQSLGESRESMLLIAAQLDFAFMGIPLVMLVDLMRGPSDEVAPIEPTAR